MGRPFVKWAGLTHPAPQLFTGKGLGVLRTGNSRQLCCRELSGLVAARRVWSDVGNFCLSEGSVCGVLFTPDFLFICGWKF